jgi:hypothetical protein
LAGQSITFSVKASDPAGIQFGYLTIRKDGQIIETPPLMPIEKDNSILQCTFATDKYTVDGDYKILEIQLCDMLFNYSSYFIDNKAFHVKNPYYHPGVPTVSNIKFSKSNVKPGECIDIEVCINANGKNLSDEQSLAFTGLKNNLVIHDYIFLTKSSTGVYIVHYNIPANSQPGLYGATINVSEKNQSKQTYYGKCNNYVFPKLKVSSVFTGLENKSVLKGSGKFDVLSGVSASNETEGDMTDKIEVQGTVDTNKTGLYLLRYKIKSNQTINYNGVETPVYYLESRWIGVSDILPYNTTALSLTTNKFFMGAQSSDILIKRDGKSISYASIYSAKGTYTISDKDALTTDGIVSAVIDKSGPAINYKLSGKKSGFTVSIKADDPSGCKTVKYLAGVKSAADIKTKGIDISSKKAFAVNKNGKYTLYAVDSFGYATLKVIDVKFVSIKSLKFTRASVKVYKNKTIATGLKFSPSSATNKAVTYQSANTKIATVSAAGVIKGISRGKVKIYAYATDGSGKKAIITVTVK